MSILLEKIISGCQTGADSVALAWAIVQALYRLKTFGRIASCATYSRNPSIVDRRAGSRFNK